MGRAFELQPLPAAVRHWLAAEAGLIDEQRAAAAPA